MPVYAYKGLSEQGRAVSGIIDADNPKGARLKLRKTGVFPTDLTEEEHKRPVTAAEAAEGGLNLGRYFASTALRLYDPGQRDELATDSGTHHGTCGYSRISSV